MLTLRAMILLHEHLAALKGLLARMEPEHVGRENVKAKIREAEEGLARG